MQYVVECWSSCGEEFVVHAPDRRDPALVEGVPAVCTECGAKYTFTVDGDGEPSLDSLDEEQLGENISGVRSDESTHY